MLNSDQIHREIEKGNWSRIIYQDVVTRLDEIREDLKELLDLLDFCVGFDYFIPLLEVEARVEFYHQGSGVRVTGEYDENKLLSGEQMVLAEDYLLFYLERSFLDYFSVNATGLININDGSLGFIPEISGEPYSNLQVGLGAMLFLGPEGSEFDGEYSGTFDLTEPAVYLRCKLSF